METRDIQDGDDLDDDYQESMLNAFIRLRKFLLDKKPHIKEYRKIRGMHSQIVNTMIQYHHDGKFKEQIDTGFVSGTEPEKTVYLLESTFDLETSAGTLCFYDMWIYKTSSNMACITEDFIRNHRYRKPEKIEFLYSMLDSKPGLFEIMRTDMEEGYVYIKDVFTGDEYAIIDIGLSMSENDYYIYTRIISYHGINFSSGLNFLFKKTDSFIRNFIKRHGKDFTPNGELLRFTQLYNRYSRYPNKIEVVTNKV
jgi:hypothetical protein